MIWHLPAFSVKPGRMSTLSSSSTLAEVQAAYDDNASYAEDESASKAAAFITACRILLRRVAKRAAHGGRGANEVEHDPGLLRAEMREAIQYVASAGQRGPAIKHPSMEYFRG